VQRLVGVVGVQQVWSLLERLQLLLLLLLPLPLLHAWQHALPVSSLKLMLAVLLLPHDEPLEPRDEPLEPRDEPLELVLSAEVYNKTLSAYRPEHTRTSRL
jgi:hypothetical protein